MSGLTAAICGDCGNVGYKGCYFVFFEQSHGKNSPSTGFCANHKGATLSVFGNLRRINIVDIVKGNVCHSYEKVVYFKALVGKRNSV